MRNAKNVKIAVSALSAAAFSALIGASSFGQVVNLGNGFTSTPSPLNPGQGTNPGSSIISIGFNAADGGSAGHSSGGFTDYVLDAKITTGSAGNTSIIGQDVAIITSSTGGGLVFDTADDVDGDGIADANVVGGADQSFSQPQPTFGSLLGTFIGLPNGPTGTTALKVTTNDGVVAVYDTPNVPFAGGSPQANYLSANGTDQTLIDPELLNGTDHGLEVVGAFTNAANNGPLATGTAINFANIVVPTGTIFTVIADIGPQSSPGEIYTIANTSTPTGSITLSVTNTTGGTPVSLVSHGSGNYVAVTVPVSGQAVSVTVNGFIPGDTEIFGVEANGATSLATLITDLQKNDPGVTVELPTGTAGPLLTAAGDNIEIVSTPGTNPSTISIDATAYAALDGNGTVTFSNITVVPEPTSISALALGGAALLARRKRARLA